MSAPGAAEGQRVAPELSWVLPLFRTSAQLPELLARIHTVSTELNANGLLATWEIILVDDACPEGSGALAQRLAANEPRLRVLRLARNHGQDGALRQGLKASLGAWALILDADLQDPPEALASLWPLRSSETDAVFAERTGNYTSRGRHFTSRLYRAAVERAGRLPRGACLFVLLARPLVDRLNAAGAGHHALLSLIAANASSFASVPVARSKRLHGVSGYSSFRRCAKAIRSLWQMLSIRRFRPPTIRNSRPASLP